MTQKVPSGPSEVPSFLTKSVPGFRASAEFNRLDDASRRVPGLILGQLTIYLRRLQTELIHRQIGADVARAELQDIYSALEALARSPSNDVQNLLVVDVLEHLHGSSEIREAILSSLGPSTRDLYAKWVEPGPSLP